MGGYSRLWHRVVVTASQAAVPEFFILYGTAMVFSMDSLGFLNSIIVSLKK
jgi:hypothetical protein